MADETIEQNGNPDPGIGSGNPDHNNSDPNNPNPTKESTPAGSDLGFKNPLLKGKTAEEIERLITIQQQTVQEQRRQLDRRAEAQSVESGRPDPSKGDNLPFTDKEFWDSPSKAFAKAMNQMVEPLQREIRSVKTGITAPTIRERFRKENPEFTELEPQIDNMLRAYGRENPAEATEEELETVFNAVYGKAVRLGIIKPNGGGNPPPPPNGESKVTIPQHRPSPAPVPQSNNPNKPKLRELDENERRLAREFFGHLPNEAERHKAYLDMQSLDEEEVAGSNIGRTS